MMNVVKYWLDQGADGFRIDAINFMLELEELPDEIYKNINGSKEDYDNLYHNHTMDQVSLK